MALSCITFNLVHSTKTCFPRISTKWKSDNMQATLVTLFVIRHKMYTFNILKPYSACGIQTMQILGY